MTGYCLDTNVFIDGRNSWYRPDRFPTLWSNLTDLSAAGRAMVPREVSEELARGDDDCVAFLAGVDGFVCEGDEDVFEQVGLIAVAFDGWVSDTTNYADPFVVAHAQVRQWVAVTNERVAGPGTHPHNQKIPNVCAHFGVECITFPDLIDREGWIF